MIPPAVRTVLLLISSTNFAFAGVDILANTATFKPKVTVSDHYSERVDTEVIGHDYFRTQEPNAQAITVRMTANLEGASTGVIDARTTVGVTAGYFDHSAALGEALDYKPGAKRATFALTKDVDQANGNTRTVRVGSVIYEWTSTTLDVTVNCIDVEGAYVGEIAASDYVGNADVGKPINIVDDPIDTAVTFGNAYGSRTVYLRGVTKTTTRGCGFGSNYETFDLCEVTLQGTADVTGPVVKPVFPAQPNALNKIDVVGTATDLTWMTMGAVAVNGIATAVTRGAGDPGTGLWNWKALNLPLKKGLNTVVISFSDDDGNVTKITKTYTLLR